MISEFAGYRIRDTLGSGAMGTVYLADHPRLPRQVALKVLPTSLSIDPAFRSRFEREAETLARLDHPNIVDVYDRGEHDGLLWLAMEYVQGGDAAQHVAGHGPMPPALVAHIVSAVADALDYAWSTQQLLHRDVKPANILVQLGDTVVVKLADFGVARLGDEPTSLTGTAMTVGTLAYIPPESIDGRPVDHRGDQYALACTAYFLLTGQAPFSGETAVAVMAAQLGAPVPSVASTVGPAAASGIDAAIARATAKDPQRRFGSASEFAAALRAPSHAVVPTPAYAAAAVHPTPVLAASAPMTAPPAPQASNGSARWLIIGLGALVLVAALAAGLFFAVRGSSDDPPSTASDTSTSTITSPTAASPTALTGLAGIWSGSYQCNQGTTSLVLEMNPAGDSNLDVTFRFGPTADNPGVPTGAYTMTATPSGDDLRFTPRAWIDRPGAYLMVPLVTTGPIDGDARTLSGTVLSTGCSSFTVSR
ncbi:serine/threonine protein kinase [Gordonia sp. HY442]|uniref:serine/threonine-protein kinase n=1 Tax=Gordonia zhenghanii TaxID=2911516 RepID=UPI001F3547E6|nr:serine/threonine-protein kinase [Gordonia zhenghanii]MCF8606562.1 serine/threonine protein kinase [Gordonia zhenghanii]